MVVRGQRVSLDADLAQLYGTNTKRLNEQVKRNRGRFPTDFLFQLTAEEKALYSHRGAAFRAFLAWGDESREQHPHTEP